jgi:hypothetical protein
MCKSDFSVCDKNFKSSHKIRKRTVFGRPVFQLWFIKSAAPSQCTEVHCHVYNTGRSFQMEDSPELGIMSVKKKK